METWERNQLFRPELVDTALERLLPIRSSRVRYVCCTVLHDGSEYGGAQGKGGAAGATAAHIGTNPANLRAYVVQPMFDQRLLPQLEGLISQISENPGPYVIACWCNAGEHRSVGVAALLAKVGPRLGWNVVGGEAQHVCRASWLWRRGGCGGCSECTAGDSSEAAELFFAKIGARRERPHGGQA